MKCFDTVHLQFSKCPSEDKGCQCNLLYALTSGCPQQCSAVNHEAVLENASVTELCGPNDIKAATLGFGHLLPFFDARGDSRSEDKGYDYEYEYEEEEDDCDNGDDSDDGSQWHQNPRPGYRRYPPSTVPDSDYYNHAPIYYPPSSYEYGDRYGVPSYRPDYPDRNEEYSDHREYRDYNRIDEEDDEDCDGSRPSPGYYRRYDEIETDRWPRDEPWTQGEPTPVWDENEDFDLVRISGVEEPEFHEFDEHSVDDHRVATVQGIIPGLPRLRKWLRAKKHDIEDFAAPEDENNLTAEDAVQDKYSEFTSVRLSSVDLPVTTTSVDSQITTPVDAEITSLPTSLPSSSADFSSSILVTTSIFPLSISIPVETGFIIAEKENGPTLEANSEEDMQAADLKDKIQGRFEECDEQCQTLRSQHGCIAGEGCNFIPNIKDKFHGGHGSEECNEPDGCSETDNKGSMFNKLPNFKEKFHGCDSNDEECAAEEAEQRRLEELHEKQKQQQLEEPQKNPLEDSEKNPEIEEPKVKEELKKVIEEPAEELKENPKDDTKEESTEESKDEHTDDHRDDHRDEPNDGPKEEPSDTEEPTGDDFQQTPKTDPSKPEVPMNEQKTETKVETKTETKTEPPKTETHKTTTTKTEITKTLPPKTETKTVSKTETAKPQVQPTKTVTSSVLQSPQLARIITSNKNDALPTDITNSGGGGKSEDCEDDSCEKESNNSHSMPDFSRIKNKIPSWQCAEESEDCETYVKYIGGSNTTNSSSPGVIYNSTTVYAMLGNGSDSNSTRFISVGISTFDDRNSSNSKQNGTVNIANAKNAQVGASVSESVSSNILNGFTLGMSFFVAIYWLH